MKDASGIPGLAGTASITHRAEQRYLAIHYSAAVRQVADESELAEPGSNPTDDQENRNTRRALGRPTHASHPTASANMAELRHHARRNGAGQPPRCSASGWRLRIDSADSSCDATCPLCGQHVRAVPENIAGHSVLVISEHSRLTAP